MYLFKSLFKPVVRPDTIQKMSSSLYADYMFSTVRFPQGTRETSNNNAIEAIKMYTKPEFKSLGLAPADNLRRYRDELSSPIYREPVENLKYNIIKTKVQRASRIDSPIIKWGSTKAFSLKFISNSIYDAAKNLYIVKNGTISFSGYTHNNQNLRVQYLESGVVIHNFQADKFTGDFSTSFTIPEGRANLVFVSYGSNLPTEVNYINIKLDTTITNTTTDFLEVLPTEQITKSELQTTKLYGTIEEDSTITKVQVSDGTSILTIPLINVTVNASWEYQINIPDLSSLKDGQIIAYVTIQDKAGNTGTVSSSIDLFKFAFSPIVMFI